MSKKFSLFLFLSFFSFSASHAGLERVALHYQCFPTSVEERYLLRDTPGRKWTVWEMQEWNMEFNLVYPPFQNAKPIRRDGRTGLYKSLFFFYGDYKLQISAQHIVNRKIDVNFLELVEDHEFEMVAERETFCRSFFCALGSLLEYSPKKMVQSSQKGYLHYVGGSTVRETPRQLAQEDFTDTVFLGLSHGAIDVIERALAFPTSLFISEVPEEFAVIEGGPENFQMGAVMLDEMFGIFDLNNQNVHRYDIELICHRMENLNYGEIFEVLSFSQTARNILGTMQNNSMDPKPQVHRSQDPLRFEEDTFDSPFDGNKSFNRKQLSKWSALGVLMTSYYFYRKFLNPVGVAATVLVATEARSDICASYGDGEQGLYFLSQLSLERQIEIVEACKEVRDNLMGWMQKN